MNYEQSLKELEIITQKLESGDCDLSQALELFDKGVELSKNCVNQISQAKGKLTILKEQLDNIVEENFDI